MGSSRSLGWRRCRDGALMRGAGSITDRPADKYSELGYPTRDIQSAAQQLS